ncbi:heavy metal translocating P-type ATPase metal-binding domain-containing protein [Pedobacter sp. UBA4863]|uniref:heavy metal translocating P-type ATPase n=1 Tax=Pedobacter sp. UBA4863 TaxID=1947060 RepID=UPI0025EEE4D9|nr:heavy metal translocating P-type ATPase metal-binding domain-containing protein [Pedobacter sp. UBA4863]
MSSTTLTQKSSVCYHCGDKLPAVKLNYDEKDFCCVGCQSVYQILSENNMCNYYAYNSTPGQRVKETGHFEYLDEPSIITQLINYKDKENSIVTFYIPAIHCSSCIWLLEHLYKINPAIFSSRIDFLKKEVTISYKHEKVSLREVVEILNQTGYEPLISLQDVVKEKGNSVNKQLIWKIAIAGFCMGNVMLFSFPEYFGLSALEKEFQYLFAWLNLAFCIPVTFYCAKEYFTSAYASLKQKYINLDTPLALIIAVLFIRTAISTIFDTGPGFGDTLTGLVFLLLMGKWVKQRTYHHISFDRDYRSYFPIAITSIKDNREKPIAISEIAVGDRLLIRNGELVPADAILMKGDGWLDMSFVTGEAEPQQKVLGEIVYAGGRQIGEAIELEVIKPASQSYLTGLWNKEFYKTDFKKKNFNDSIAKYFSIGVFAVAIAATAYWLWQNDSVKAWSAFTAVIIVACPCVLALSTPFTLSAILSIFDKKGFYVKNTDALEQLADLDTIVFDKTGTLTTTHNSGIYFDGSLTDEEKLLVASLIYNSSHPLSRQVLKTINPSKVYTIEKYNEVPGKGIMGEVNGKMIYAGSKRALPFEVDTKEQSGVHIVIDEVYKGCFSVEQQWREGIKPLIHGLSKGYDLRVLSGDTNKDEQMLKAVFKPATPMFFNQSPHQKLEAITSLQAQNKKVMMLGDGLNDAGALKQANFGIAITDNINNFTPGCDAIMSGSSLNLLPNFIKQSKNGLQTIKISFAIATSYNLIGVYFAVQGTLYPLVAAILMPISTITIISFTSLATRYFAKKNGLK